jgi:hypothetical protein
MQIPRSILLSGMLFLLVTSCKKDDNFIPDNDAPYYGAVPTVQIENYINRSFIDLIGREPLDAEMDYYVLYLRSRDLQEDARDSMLYVLQNDTQFIAGDTSYRRAYYQRVYDLSKTRFIEGASDAYIQGEIGILSFGVQVDTLNGDYASASEKMLAMQRLQNIIDSRTRYMNGEITLDSMCGYMLNNSIYDFINMNSFNFVNASFDDLYWRYPTQSEFMAGFSMVEFNQSEMLFGMSGTNKSDYLQILLQQTEMKEGNVIWAYQTLLARTPTTTETVKALTDFIQDNDYQKLQRKLMVTDEYAGFKKG